MPWCWLVGAGFLDEQVVMVKPALPASRQLSRDLPDVRFHDEAGVGIDLLPVTKVFEEAARIVRSAGDFCAIAGIAKVFLNAGFEQRKNRPRMTTAPLRWKLSTVPGASKKPKRNPLSE